MTVLTRTDGLTALGEAEQASRQWGGDAAQPLWRAALVRLTTTSGAGSIGLDLMSRSMRVWYTAPPADRWVLPLYDGDPPPVGSRLREGCLYRRDELTHELVSRALLRPAVRGSAVIRETHRAVHQALADDDTSACRWCR